MLNLCIIPGMNPNEIGSCFVSNFIQEFSPRTNIAKVDSSLPAIIERYSNPYLSAFVFATHGDVQEVIYAHIGAFLPFQLVENLGLDTLPCWQIAMSNDPSVTSMLMLGFHERTQDRNYQQARASVYVQRVPNVKSELVASKIGIAGLSQDTKGQPRILRTVYDGVTKRIAQLAVSVDVNDLLPYATRDTKFPDPDYLKLVEEIHSNDGLPHSIATGLVTQDMVGKTQFDGSLPHRVLLRGYYKDGDYSLGGYTLGTRNGYYVERSFGNNVQIGRHGANGWHLAVPEGLYTAEGLL